MLNFDFNAKVFENDENTFKTADKYFYTKKSVRFLVKKCMRDTLTTEKAFEDIVGVKNDTPMPLREMTGVILEEMDRVVKVRVHGDVYTDQYVHCMCCGRKLTHPVSRFFGIGPVCGKHYYQHPFNTDEEIAMSLAIIKKEIQDIVWEGYIIKTAIIQETEVEDIPYELPFDIEEYYDKYEKKDKVA